MKGGRSAPLEADAVVAANLVEVLLSDQLISELGIEIIDAAGGFGGSGTTRRRR